MKTSPAPLLALYDILEVQFDPLGLCKNVAPILDELSASPEFSPYIPHIRRVILSRLLSQLSQVYSSISISHLLDLVAPLNKVEYAEDDIGRFDQENIEAFIMSTAKRGELLVRINHSDGSLTFVDDTLSSIASSSNAINVQPSPGKLVRSRLSNLAECLYTVFQNLHEKDMTLKIEEVLAVAQAERKALQVRRSIVARRRELLAELTARKQSEERSQQAELNRRAQEEAQKRKKDDALREARERARAEMDRRRKEDNVKIVSSLKDRGVSVDVVSNPFHDRRYV